MRWLIGVAMLAVAAPIVAVVEMLAWLDDWSQDDPWNVEEGE
jgi:hypothetical protein